MINSFKRIRIPLTHIMLSVNLLFSKAMGSRVVKFGPYGGGSPDA